MDRKWLGTHIFVVRGTNGVEDNSAGARGDSGFYESVDSAPLAVTITDPCDYSIVNSVNQFAIGETFEVPLGSEEKVLA